MTPANPLIIMSDEHDPRWMGCAGSFVATPNLYSPPPGFKAELV